MNSIGIIITEPNRHKLKFGI